MKRSVNRNENLHPRPAPIYNRPMRPKTDRVSEANQGLVSWVSLLAFTISTIGCPVMGPRSARSAKGTRPKLMTSADRNAPSDASHAPATDRLKSGALPQNGTAIPESPGEQPPIVGFLLVTQPSMSTVRVEVPQLINSVPAPVIAPCRLPEGNCPPDAHPPRAAVC